VASARRAFVPEPIEFDCQRHACFREEIMLSDLIAFWRRCALTAPPFAHPDDWPVLRRYGGRYIDEAPKDFARFIASDRFGDFTDRRLHLSLLPIPYGGALRSADIVILLLNPGFSFTDYYAETNAPEYRRRLEQTLSQDFEGVDFPFVWLDPQYCWHSGFGWWEGKLRDVITVIARERFGGRYLDALRDVSKRLAHIELVPYHSPAFAAHSLLKHLPSAQAVKRFAQGALVEAANNGDKTIIVTRQAASWELPGGTRNLVVYEGGLTRGASLGRRTPGGRAILNRYGILGA
jgi:hypothetical protein